MGAHFTHACPVQFPAIAEIRRLQLCARCDRTGHFTTECFSTSDVIVARLPTIQRDYDEMKKASASNMAAYTQMALLTVALAETMRLDGDDAPLDEESQEGEVAPAKNE